MSRWTKALIGLVVVAILAAGAVGGRTLAQGSPGDEQGSPRQEEFLGRVAAKLGVSVDELKEAIRSAGQGMVDEAVEEGKVRPEAGDRLRQRIEEGHLPPIPSRHRPQPSRLGPVQKLVLHAAAETLDMTPRELVGELRSSGQSLAQLAEGRGVSREELKSAILGDAEEHLDRLVGRLSGNIDRIIDRIPGSPPAPPTE